MSSSDWFEVVKHKDYLYVIREKLDELDPRYRTKYVNLYLLIGEKKALLIDTGNGLFPLKPVIDEIIGTKDLIVVNTHFHFDHRGSNDEFPEIFIHEIEKRIASLPYDISHIKDSPKEIANEYSKKGFILNPPSKVNPLKEGDEFDLGGIIVRIIHTPGHSVGSISLVTNTEELFTGDTAHYGAMFLSKKRKLHVILESLSKLLRICEDSQINEIYPSHEDYAVGKELLSELIDGISNIDKYMNNKIRDEFLGAWVMDAGKFKYIM
jgi:glyoxylase-like metal-dependent hydrolase (beta-lactamase superfamily II)